jgi:hypothetical protein
MKKQLNTNLIYNTSTEFLQSSAYLISTDNLTEPQKMTHKYK